MHPKVQLERDISPEEERKEDRDFYNYCVGAYHVKCHSCNAYVERGNGFPEGSENPTNCSEACRDLSFERAAVQPRYYLKDGKTYENIGGQLVEIIEKEENRILKIGKRVGGFIYQLFSRTPSQF